jgi:hypothetical protein
MALVLGGNLVSCSINSVNDSLRSDQIDNSIGSGPDDPTEEKNTDGNENADAAITKPLPGKKWKVVERINGKKNKKSKPFRIRGKEWKVSWNLEDNTSPDAEFIVILHNKKDPSDTEIIANQIGNQDDFVPIQRGDGGEYYLDINAKGGYEITIEEYR